MKRILLNVVCLVGGVIIGMILVGHTKEVDSEPLSVVPSADYFTQDQSFSEIQNAKAACQLRFSTSTVAFVNMFIKVLA